MGIHFQFCQVKKLWKSGSQQCEMLKMVTMVKFECFFTPTIIVFFFKKKDSYNGRRLAVAALSLPPDSCCSALR